MAWFSFFLYPHVLIASSGPDIFLLFWRSTAHKSLCLLSCLLRLAQKSNPLFWKRIEFFKPLKCVRGAFKTLIPRSLSSHEPGPIIEFNDTTFFTLARKKGEIAWRINKSQSIKWWDKTEWVTWCSYAQVHDVDYIYLFMYQAMPSLNHDLIIG